VAHERHEAVRQRYAYSCGYCGVSETDTAGELTVDHYRPVCVGGDETDENLIYCCARCNLYKGGFWPTPDDVAVGRRVLHPTRDNFAEHLRLNVRTGEVEALTEVARFHISLLQLNRPALMAHRLRKQLLRLLMQAEKLLQEENAQLRATIAGQREYLTRLRSLLGIPD
jgi:hypothetical protein